MPSEDVPSLRRGGLSRTSFVISHLAGDKKPWAWSMRQLARKRPDTGARLRIAVAQTVLLESGEPVLWIFTAKTGEVMRKNTDKLRADLVRDTLCGRKLEEESAKPVARELPPDAETRYVASVRRGHKGACDLKASMLTEVELARILSGEEKNTVVGLQSYIAGVTHSGTRYRCEAVLDAAAGQRRLGLSVSKLCYLGAAVGSKGTPHPRSGNGSSDVGPAFVIKCQMTNFNGLLQQATREIVAHLEAVTRQQATRVVARSW